MASLPTLLQPADPSTNFPTTSLHLLPFHVSYSGPARIANYFPIISSSDDADNKSNDHALYKSYFRGRMLVGVDVPLPDGYTGQIWKSNAPSMSSSSSTNQRASTSKRTITSMEDSSSNVDYSASSPRRSPRKHASATSSTSSNNASNGSTSASMKAATMKAKGKKKPPPKRQRFAMSPDVSPVKEAVISTEAATAFEEALDKAADSLMAKEEEDNKDESVSSEEVFVTSPAKKRAKLEEAAVETAPGPKESGTKSEEEDSAITAAYIAESTTTTLQAAGDTITSTTVKLERAITPPPPSSASALDATVPSTPMSASSILPINIISPQTPQTPRASLFQHHKDDLDAQNQDEVMTEGERIHQRLISQIGIFDKITIWNPDMQLDKGDDCYVKSLNEWTHLANLIHS